MRTSTPELLPMLSAGAHRRPEDGACFMEFASVLAGERFSDHPACTHPLLAAVARAVNDLSTDAGRQRLIPLIPAVIGTADSDPIIAGELLVMCYRAALAMASSDRHRRSLTCKLHNAEHRLRAAERRAAQPRRGMWPPAGLSHLPYSWTKGHDCTDIALVLSAVTGEDRDADEKLANLLRSCIDRYHQLARRSAAAKNLEPSSALAGEGGRIINECR